MFNACLEVAIIKAALVKSSWIELLAYLPGIVCHAIHNKFNCYKVRVGAVRDNFCPIDSACFIILWNEPNSEITSRLVSTIFWSFFVWVFRRMSWRWRQCLLPVFFCPTQFLEIWAVFFKSLTVTPWLNMCKQPCKWQQAASACKHFTIIG